MTSVAPRRATYDDLVALPRNIVGEIIDGKLSGARSQLLGAWRGAESARAAPFEELELELAALWARSGGGCRLGC